ncbi:hypothetical protein LINPERHAP1_LOCUS21349 [Linum perenne]
MLSKAFPTYCPVDLSGVTQPSRRQSSVQSASYGFIPRDLADSSPILIQTIVITVTRDIPDEFSEEEDEL